MRGPEDHGEDAGTSSDLASLEERLATANLKLVEVASVEALATKYRDEIEAARSQTLACSQEVQQIVAQLRGFATEALAVKAQIDGHQAVIVAKSDHIEQAQVHADKVRSDLDRQLTAGTQQATETEAQRARAEAAATSAQEHLSDAKSARAAVDSERAAVQNLAEEARAAFQAVTSLANRADSIEQRVGDYEAQLGKLLQAANERIATIDGLLPGATSAGLSRAFDLRRESFTQPSKTWQWVFVGSVGTLVLLALTGLLSVIFASTPLTYDELFRLWLARLPIAGALVWLALYASREAALAKRLEEDYGYKSAIAASFEGFHKQMSDIASQASPDSPLSQLCSNTLSTIASPPGRIYEKHALTVSPSAEAAELVRATIGNQPAGKVDAKPS